MIEKPQTAYDMISGMTPEFQVGQWVFVTTNDQDIVAELSEHAVSIFKEKEGMSLIVPLDLARERGFSVAQPMRWITLNVYSSLEGVGLTAAVSSALSENSIPCNMVAAFHHDHVFVPSELGDRAMQVLVSLQDQVVKDP